MSAPNATCLLFDFVSPGTVADWDAIDDRVMGGVSSSRLRNDPAGHAVFEGHVSLERNGGFASVRSTPADRGRPGAQTCFIEARAAGRRFKLNLLTDDAFDSINYQAGYHEHFVRRAGDAQRRHLSDDALLVHIKAIHAQTHGGYGWPRMWKELLARGIHVSKQRVQKLMQLHGIRAKGKRRFKFTTDSNHDLPIAPNLLNREFNVDQPDKVWAGDITYIATDEGWLFLAVVIDLFSRQVIGWSLRLDMTREIVIDALRMAWFRRRPSKLAGQIFHSDRGSQYASMDYRDALAEYGIAASMSRRGDCRGNACSETLFGSLKVERLHGRHFQTRRQAMDEVIAWMLCYNRTRLHSTLAYISPMQFEENWLANQPRQASA